jgi:hypothetical protein
MSNSFNGPTPPKPQLGARFKKNRWNENSLEQLKKELEEEIHADSGVSADSAVIVRPEASGNHVTRIAIEGHVQNETERQRVREIVAINTFEEVEVDNELVIKGR